MPMEEQKKWYVVDEKKGSCYEHRHDLHKLDFNWDADARKWYTTTPIPGEIAEQLGRMGIAPEGAGSASKPKQEPGWTPEAGSKPPPSAGPAKPVDFYKRGELAREFNDGAFLHSRAKSGKPIDAFYKKAFVSIPGSEFTTFVSGRIPRETSYVIVSIQQNTDQKGDAHENLWLFACNDKDIIVGRFKVKIEESKPKKE